MGNNIATEITRLETAKTDIEAAIEECGVSVPDDNLISTYATYIRQIPSVVVSDFKSDLTLEPVGGADSFIRIISQTDGLISATPGGLVSTSSSGLVPKADGSDVTISDLTNDWVLAKTGTGDDIKVDWCKLPTFALQSQVDGMQELVDDFNADIANLYNDKSDVGHTHNTSEITALTSYAKATEQSDIATTDTLNTALGKLEYKTDLGVSAYTWVASVTGDDADRVINKWEEIIAFVNSVAEGKDISTLFVTVGSQQTITGPKRFVAPVTVGSFTNGSASNNWFPVGSGTLTIGGCSNTCSDDGGTTKYPVGAGTLNVGSIINVGKYETGYCGIINCGDINVDGNLKFARYGQGITTTSMNFGSINPITVTADSIVNPTALTISGSSKLPIHVNSSSTTEAGIGFYLDGVYKGSVEYHNTGGLMLYNSTASASLSIKDDGTATVGGNTIYHAGNLSTFSTSANGLVPKPSSNSSTLFLAANGSWATPAGGSSYTLPTASSTTLGGVKVGNGLAISSGTLSTAAYVSTTANSAYPVLFKYSTGTTTTAAASRFNQYITINPSTRTLNVGNASGTSYLGQVNAGIGFFETSDERLKDFSEDIDCDLERLSKLPKKYFRWKDSDDKNLHIGTSAQAVQEIYPELVSENEHGTLSVAYDKLSIISLAAVDKLNTKVKSLEERLSKLESILSNLINS